MQQQHQQQQSLPRKSEQQQQQQQQHHLSAADYSKAASGGGVIVGPSQRIDRDSMRPDHREQLQRSFELQQQQQRLEARDQRHQPTVSYSKPYKQTPRLVTGSHNSGGNNNNSGGGGGGNNGSNPNIPTSRSPKILTLK
jgi:hypothetical protein